MADLRQAALDLHLKLNGKITTGLKAPLSPENLPLLYTPGVGAVSQAIAANADSIKDYTGAGSTVAVISDGSAVLGLGNIGAAAALPVMEGKAYLFKALADVDAVPLVLDTQDTEEIIAIVKAVAPNFAGINLEDIGAPRCFEIERRLQDELEIPVMHDDQHATAIVTLAGLINACKVTGRMLKEAKVRVIGAGAAGNAVIRLLYHYGVTDLLLLDSKGVVTGARTNLDPEKQQLVALTSAGDAEISNEDAFKGADIVIGVSQPGTITPKIIKSMAKDPIVFAMANPEPEILPEDAHEAGAAVVATGRSDFPNQINNVLVFPGVFRGAIDGGLRKITLDMKVKTGEALASIVDEPRADEIIPSIFNDRVVPIVSETIGRSRTN